MVAKLRQIEVLMGEGKGLQQAIREAGITDATYYRWRKEYGGLKGNHSLTEWYDPRSGHLGPQNAFLAVLTLVGIDSVTQPALLRRSDA